MEDYARFALDDAGLSERAKQIRHGLAVAFNAAHLSDIIRSRDILEDAGRSLRTPQEYERADAADAVVAAGKRLSEALRVIEEYGKTVSREFGQAVEQLRYQGYDLEKKLCIGVHARRRFGGARLYVLITESLCRDDWFQTARAAIEGGAECIQLREKALSDRELLERARRLADLCHEHEVIFIVNDRADVAAASNADGLHVGRDDVPVRDARRVLGPRPLIGTSTHTPEQARAAIEQDPDYVAVGPMFASTTKPQDILPGPSLLGRVRAMTSLPLVAIGGITADNVVPVIHAGGRCIGVCSAVISQADVAGAARKLTEAIARAIPSDERV